MSRKRLPRTNAFELFQDNGSSNDESYHDNSDLDPESCPARDSSESDEDASGPCGLWEVGLSHSDNNSAKRAKFGSTPRSRSSDTQDNNIMCTAGSDVDESDSEIDESPEPEPQHTEDPTNDWTEDLNNFPTIPPFTGKSGLNTDLVDTENSSTLYCFKLFFDDYIIKLLKVGTNKYAAELSTTEPHCHKKVVMNWKTVTLSEMRGFLLILIHMGVVKKPSITDYWTTHEFCATTFAGRIMARDRFSAILSMFHFSDNATYINIDQPGHDPLHKIRKIYEHLQEKFEDVYTPLKEIVVNETMCSWHGKLRFKVNLRDKPTPGGIKFYDLCESVSGYVHRFEIYAAEPNVSNKPADVVLRLTEPLLGQGFHLFTDDYYTCPTLYEQLVARQTLCTGTVRVNRVGMPKDIAKMKLAVGQIVYRRKALLAACKWRAKREVTILTSAVDPSETTTVYTRNFKEKTKPSAVVQYTRHTNGVDHSDQLLAYLPLSGITSKWSTKLFMHLMTRSIIQASIICNKIRATKGEKRLPLPSFVKHLGKELTEEFIEARGEIHNREPPRNIQRAQTLLRLDHTVFHSLASLPPTMAKARPRRQCKVCYDRMGNVAGKRKRAKETHFLCEICQVPLCLEPCFKLFHHQADFANSV